MLLHYASNYTHLQALSAAVGTEQSKSHFIAALGLDTEAFASS